MSPLILFVMLILISFGALLYFLRPSGTEAAVERHLTSLEDSRFVRADGTILREERLSKTPWVHEFLLLVPGTQGMLRLSQQAGSPFQVSSLLAFSVVAGLLTWWLASLFSSSVSISALIGLSVAAVPFIYLYFQRANRLRRCDDLLPEAVDLMARALRAGHAVTSVVEMVSQEIANPLGGEFRRVHEETSLGLPLREAMLNLVERVPRDDMRFLATAVLLQKETGGNLAQILDKTATVMRERARLRGQLRIYTAQGRITGWILCSMPFLMFILIDVVNPDYERILITDPLGIRLIYIGLVMMMVGVLIIRKIIDIKV